MGGCTEEERQIIQRWIETLDDPSLNLKTDTEPEFDEDYTWSKMAQGLPELENRMSVAKAKPIQLFKNSMKYAAAACFVLVVFFGGRFSAGTATASPTPKDPTSDHLFIYGGNGAKGNLSGDAFKVAFDGTIKLYNNGLSNKTIIVGDSSFTIEPRKNYYLTGNPEYPKLKDYNYETEGGYRQDELLEGDLSILRLNQ